MHTASSLGTWQTCKRLYRYKYVDLVRLVSQGTPRMVGSAVHAGLEAFALGSPAHECVVAAERYSDDPWWLTHEGLIELARSRVMLRAYCQHWSATRNDWETIEAEAEWERDGIGGKRDALLRHKTTGELYLVEHKTTSEEVDNTGCDYWQRLAIDTQITLYQQDAEAKYGERVGILYDVIRKPSGGPQLKVRATRRKTETEEEYQARKESARESLPEFEDRLFAEMVAEPDKYLVRHEVHRTHDQATELLAEMRETVAEIDGYQGIYPRSDSACKSRYGVCPYLGVCTGVMSLDDPRFVKVDTAHVELSNNKEDDYADCPI
jgi:hypothetical protein